MVIEEATEQDHVFLSTFRIMLQLADLAQPFQYVLGINPADIEILTCMQYHVTKKAKQSREIQEIVRYFGFHEKKCNLINI